MIELHGVPTLDSTTNKTFRLIVIIVNAKKEIEVINQMSVFNRSFKSTFSLKKKKKSI